MSAKRNLDVATHVTHSYGIVRPNAPSPERPQNRRIATIIIGIIILVALGITVTMRVYKPTNLNNVAVVKQKVSKHYLLPTSEQPALATVTDSAKLQANFAVPIKNGDKILIYAKTKRAIVYRPSLDRIIDVEPVTSSASNSAPSSSTTIPNINPFGN